MIDQKLIIVFYLMSLVVLINTCSETSTNNSSLFANYTPYEWETDIPQNHGFDPEKLELAVGEALLKEYIHSLLIVKDGKLVLEEYFDGYEMEEPHIVRSVSKSFLSVLVGFALVDGSIKSLDDSIHSYIPDLLTDESNTKLKKITIRNLLEMKAGIKRDHEFYMEVVNSSNWINTILEEDLVCDPGAEYHYSTASTHLLAVVLSRAIDGDLEEYLYEKLLDPMNIEIAEWEKDPQGNYFGGNNMHFVPRDLALFGQVVLDNGSLNGEQIISAEWLEKSFVNSRNEKNLTWGELNNIGYGYLWWLGELGGYNVRMAIGHGGQFIIIFPEFRLVIVTTSEAYIYWDKADQQERGVLKLVHDFIIPALK